MEDYMKIIKKISIISFCLFLTIACSSKKKEDKLANIPPEKLYSEGITKMKQNSYTEAIEYLDRISQEYPYSPLAGKAQLMESYAYYKMSKFEMAIASLQDYIALYPGEKEVEYAYYLKALCYYDQISNSKLDQSITEDALDAINELINRFPESEYAKDARLKRNLVLDHLAGKEMEVGRFYLKKEDVISAINRFQVVVKEYQTTSQIEEALYRLVECYHILGVDVEAKKYAAVLGNNYPDGRWFKHAYNLIKNSKIKK